MPIDIRFNPTQQYIIYQFSDPINIDELMEAYAQEKAYRDSVDHVVHSIVDMTNISRIPPNWLVSKVGPGFTHPRSGEILIVGSSGAIKRLLDLLFRIVNVNNIKYFTTREDADAHMETLLT